MSDNRSKYSSNRLSSQRYAPYLRKQGILSKVKTLFSWGSKEDTNATRKSSSGNSPYSEPHFDLQSEKKAAKKPIINPFKYAEPVIKSPKPLAARDNGHTPLGTGSRPSFIDVAESPNQTLSKFFAEKGDKPLSKLEMEGVLSLMSKSFYEQEESPEYNNSTVISNANELQVAKKRQPQPEPQPHQRVIPYSSIPETSKNRIRKPLLNYSHRSNTSRSPSILANDSQVSSSTTLHHSDFNHHGNNSKKLSNTANALLSLLDSKEPATANKQLPIESFANPYASSPSSTFLLSSKKRLQRQRQVKEENKFLNSPTPAAGLEKVNPTTAFSFGLNKEEKEEKEEQKVSEKEEKEEEEEEEKEDGVNDVDVEDVEDDDDDMEDDDEDDDEDENEDDEESEYQEDNESNEVVEISDSSSSELEPEAPAKEHVRANAAGTFAPTPKPTFVPVSAPTPAFETISSTSLSNPITVASSVTLSSNEFQFPVIEAPLTPAQVDELKVLQYKPLFNF